MTWAAGNESGPAFTENKGQWHSNVLYRSALQGGYAFVEKDGMSVLMLQNNFYSHLHDWIQGKDSLGISPYHTIKIKFLNASSPLSKTTEIEDLGRSENYFLGNDPSAWASDTRSFKRVKTHGVYPHIDVVYGSNKGNLKYDFIVKPGGDPSLIQVQFNGADRVELRDGELIISSSVGILKELKPFAYQESNGRMEAVACEYVLSNSVVTYHFPEGYDAERTLIIDPELEFSTFVGSTSSNFGFTASYDSEGHLYGGAIVFGGLYPTTSGAAQINFAGGAIDCGITKFSPDGTSLIYSTFIGGSGNECPHSIVVNSEDELYILGSTSSLNFPGTADAFQTTFGGGTSVAGAGFVYSNGSDIFVAKLSAAGSNLLASTYVGGSSNDGIGTAIGLDFNYGDLFRGEIVVDAAGAAYVATTTRSSNFPVVNGFDQSYSGTTSGVVFKLSSNLQNLEWSTFTGGNGNEAAYSVQLGNDNTVYFAGGTQSSTLPASNGAQSTFGGVVDGFIGRISVDGSQLLAMTYNGTSAYDQNYFVQIDSQGDVYVIGQTAGAYPITPGVYSNPNSGQYIHKLSPDLSTTIWSTTIGAGNGINISPSAFLVSNCGQIYFSGWGGTLNNQAGTTFDMPVTALTYQGSTDGNDFYVAVIDTDAESLVYATYFGGSMTAEHVDGGTSRFDKNGTVYQAVCAGCGGSSDFPTQPGVWSQTNPSSNCNLGVFKFSLSSVNAIAEVNGPDIVCPGTVFDLVNLSQGANQFHWNLGDGTESDAMALSHSFSAPGTYEISLLAEDSEGCLAPDSVTITIVVADSPEITTAPVEPICSGDVLQLSASGAVDTWAWLQPTLVSNSTTSNPFFQGTGSADLQVVGYNSCGSDTAIIVVVVGSAEISLTEDSEVCPGNSVNLVAAGGAMYTWSPATGLSNPSVANPVATPGASITYSVEITTAEGCSATETVEITVLPPPPALQGQTLYISCNGAPVKLGVTGATSYSWEPTLGLNNPSVAAPFANPGATVTYTVTGTNTCGSDDLEVEVRLSDISVAITGDTLVCYLEPFALSGSGATQYIWQPADLMANPSSQNTTAILRNTTTISLTGINQYGCTDTESLLVALYPRSPFYAGRDRVISFGEEIELDAFSLAPITWEESPWLSCTLCNYPIASPPVTTAFVASIVSDYNCREVDSVNVYVRGNLYVPNAFTPDGDGLNDIFKAVGVDITEFELRIYNRWGELVFLSDDINRGWNGSSLDRDYYSPADIYPYRIVARERYGELFEMKGMVVLVR